MPDATFRLGEFLPYRLAVIAERISRRLARDYGASHGLSVAEWRVMVHLSAVGTVSVRQITERTSLDKPRVSRAVARLCAAGYLRKAAGEGDHRLVAIGLTGPGRAALDEILPPAREVEDRLVAALEPGELARFAATLDKLHAVLDADPLARPRPHPDVAARRA